MLKVNVNGKKYGVSFNHTTDSPVEIGGREVNRDLTYATLSDYSSGEREELNTSVMIVNPNRVANKKLRRKEALGKLLRETIQDKTTRQTFWDAFNSEWGLKNTR